MGLTYRKEQQLMRMPRIESKLSKSKDGKYLIHKTVITYIRPTAYYEAVLANNLKVTQEEIEDGEDQSLNNFLEQQGIELAE
ncbi:MAG: hypothetical protein V1659_01580 [Candidatus Woesearchaeota archaeon]